MSETTATAFDCAGRLYVLTQLLVQGSPEEQEATQLFIAATKLAARLQGQPEKPE